MEAGLRLLREFLRAHPAEAAKELERIDPGEAAAVIADAPPDEAVVALRATGAMAAAEALEQMEAPSAAALLCRLETPVAAMLLRRFSLPSRQNLLYVVPDPWKKEIEGALQTAAGSVSALMDARAPVFPLDWKASDVLQYMAARPEKLSLDVFVTDRDHRLAGRIDLRAVEGRLSVRELGGMMAVNPPRLPSAAAVRFVREDALWRRFDVLPIVDAHGLFLGALSHRALRSAGRPDSEKTEESAGVALVEFAELAWTGYVAAVDVASTLTQSLSAPRETDGALHAAKD